MSDSLPSISAEKTATPAAAYPGPPRWVKIGAITTVVVVLLVVLVMVLAGGEHGPMRHTPSSSAPIHQSQLAVSLWLA